MRAQALERARTHLKRMDWVLIGSLGVLFLFGLITLYASPEAGIFQKQLILGVAAAAVLFFGSRLDWRIFKNHSLFLFSLYVLSVLALAGLFVFGARIRGIAAWYEIAGFVVQPVEIAKIILLLTLAKYLSNRHIELYRLRHIFISGLYVLIPVVLVILQPDLGSALVMIASWIGLIILSGIEVRHFVMLVVLGIVSAALLWTYGLADYQKDRILNFTNPDVDPLGGSYQTRQAMIAIGSGGLFGKGVGEGAQTRLGFLPEYETDFIFAAIGEEWGLFGLLVVLSLWALVFWRLYIAYLSVENNFSRLFIGGVMLLFAVHVTLNIGANVGTLPITGLPLPFMSSGGSNLLSSALAVGIILSMTSRSALPQDVFGRVLAEEDVL